MHFQEAMIISSKSAAKKHIRILLFISIITHRYRLIIVIDVYRAVLQIVKII